MKGTIRTIARLAAVLAVAMFLAGLTSGVTGAEQRPEAQSANDRISQCVADGGDADAWIRPDGVINVVCKNGDQSQLCQYSADKPQGGCIGISAIEPERSPTTNGTFHTDTRATAAPSDAVLDDRS